MITAIDSNVLFDYLSDDPRFGSEAKAVLQSCATQGRLMACELVWAEVAGYFSAASEVERIFTELGIEFSAITLETALDAGRLWKAYRAQGGPRSRVTADFLIGAHAALQADRLLTRDRGFYRAYFKHLSILDLTQIKHRH